MLTFGPVSSLFDFLKFGLMIGVLHAGPAEFRTGWFVESLATQTLFVFAIRTRRVPFLRSRPGGLLTATTFSVIVIGIALTLVPIGHAVGFTLLPWQFFIALLVFVNTYLVLVEVTKKIFYADREIDGIPLNRSSCRFPRNTWLAANFSTRGTTRSKAAAGNDGGNTCIGHRPVSLDIAAIGGPRSDPLLCYLRIAEYRDGQWIPVRGNRGRPTHAAAAAPRAVNQPRPTCADRRVRRRTRHHRLKDSPHSDQRKRRGLNPICRQGASKGSHQSEAFWAA